MKSGYGNKLALILLLLVSSVIASAQIGTYFTKYKNSRRLSVGFQLSGVELQGDADNIQLGPSMGVHMKYSMGQSFAIKLYGDIGTMKGGRGYQQISRNGSKQYNGNFRNGINVNDPGNQAPSEDSYHFKNNFRDLEITMVYTLGNISFLRPLRNYQFYTFLGGGVIWSDAGGDWNSKDERWEEVYGDTSLPAGPNSYEFLRYKGNNLTVPFGFGVKRNFGTLLDLGAEVRMHYARSDDLDALSAPVWRNRFMDQYTLLSVSASFKIKTNKKNDEFHYDWLEPVAYIPPRDTATFDSVFTLIRELKERVDTLMLKSREKDTLYMNESSSCCNCSDVVFPPVIFTKCNANIKPEYYGNLHTVASKMKSCPDLKICIVYPPEQGCRDKNGVSVDVRRANNVKEHLMDVYGISQSRIQINCRPIITTNSRYSENNRIEIIKGDD